MNRSGTHHHPGRPGPPLGKKPAKPEPARLCEASDRAPDWHKRYKIFRNAADRRARYIIAGNSDAAIAMYLETECMDASERRMVEVVELPD